MILYLKGDRWSCVKPTKQGIKPLAQGANKAPIKLKEQEEDEHNWQQAAESPEDTAQGHKLASGTINGINRRGMEGVNRFEAESGFHYMDSLCE